MTWRIQGISLEDQAEPQVMLTSQMYSDLLWSITPRLVEGKIYWYEAKEEGYDLHCYEIAGAESKVMYENCYLASPYEHIALNAREIVVANRAEDTQKRMIQHDLQTGSEATITIEGDVRQPLTNERRWVWGNSYDASEDKLYIYQDETQEKEIISIENLFSYGLIKDYLIVKQSGQQEGLYVYDLQNKTYDRLEASVEDYYGYTFQNGALIYCEMRDAEVIEESKFKILRISAE